GDQVPGALRGRAGGRLDATADRSLPDRQSEGGGVARRAAARSDHAHPRARRPLRRHGRDRQAHRRAGAGHHRPRARARRGGRADARPEPGRNRPLRLGLGEAGSRVAHLDHAEGDGQHPGGPADRLQRDDRLPRRRHEPVQRPEAGRAPRKPDRRGAGADRRSLHDGPHRRRDGGRVHRSAAGHPDPLRHLPADRDRRPALQVRRGVLHGRRLRGARSRRGPLDL
ncbi:MAG: Metal-dependent hydrolase, partial [uncultured Solirubrobacteraceae bacterium]